MYVGPHSLLVAVRLDFRDDVPAGDVERVSSLIEDELHDTLPDVKQVFLDATERSSDSSRRARASARD